MQIQKFNQEFPDNEACLRHLFRERFGMPYCPKCGRKGAYVLQRKTSKFICTCGRHQLSPKAGTIFEKSNTDLYKWYYAIYLFSTSKNGVSAKELERQLGVTYKTAWRIGQQVRLLCAENGVTLSGIVEVDETYVGGKRKGGQGGKGKTPVIGALARGGHVRAKVSRRETHLILNHIRDNVKRGTYIMSDKFGVYKKTTKLGYVHDSVNHFKKEWGRGIVHTNTIEGFWSQLKRSLHGTYHAVSSKHLQKYVDEFSWRYNRRENPSLFGSLISKAVQPI